MAGTLETLSGKCGLRIAACSSGILKIPHLSLLLPFPDCTIQPASSRDSDLYIGWGNKKSGRRARQLAEETGKPWLLLEDAFLRSYAPQSVSGEPPLGIVLDDEGIYYDASAPSRLESMIKQACGDPEAETQGKSLLEILRSQMVCKYNNFSTKDVTPLAPLDGRETVLLVDQTWRDQSVIGAGAQDNTFTTMFEAAIDENPNARIVAKLHPEVLASKKRGYLKELVAKANCELLTANINPWQLFAIVDKVYTVSSQMGFDALLAGKQVRCFGLPFYAGWGLTEDESPCQRRAGHRPSIAELTHAAYNAYARYKSAYDPELCDAATTVRQLATIRDAYQQNDKFAAFYQVTRWKRKRIRAMFAPHAKGQIFFTRKSAAFNAANNRQGALVAWASRLDDELATACSERNIPLYRLEDGFVRSVGLGASFHLPMSLIVDDLGIYYDARTPSRLEAILNATEFGPHLQNRAQQLIASLVDQKISKYNLAATAQDFSIPKDRHVILVPGQVDNDASIKFGGAGLDSRELLSRTRRNNPDSFIIFKAHPDVVSGLRPGLNSRQEALAHADVFAQEGSIDDMLELSDEVHTISSLTGFEALLRGKAVTCHGLPFYAGWGLTTDLTQCERRRRNLSLSELVAGALIVYPRYYDPQSGLPCGPEIVISRILEERRNPTPPTLLTRIRRIQGAIRRRLST